MLISSFAIISLKSKVLVYTFGILLFLLQSVCGGDVMSHIIQRASTQEHLSLGHASKKGSNEPAQV